MLKNVSVSGRPEFIQGKEYGICDAFAKIFIQRGCAQECKKIKVKNSKKLLKNNN